MPLSPQFLDELRGRTTLSALIGKSVKLRKAGPEHKGCCPFHHEKTPSFTVSDDKGFYHCFGCGAHGDAIRWLVDHDGMGFMDAVRELAAAAGIEVPAPSAEVARREEKAEQLAGVLEQAAGWYAEQLAAETRPREVLAARGIGAEAIERFGLGFAPPKRGVAGCGATPATLEKAGLLVEERDGYRDRFRNRIMIPIHDGRGRLVGFAGRLIESPQSKTSDAPKYINSPETAAFDKGATLFNLHRAAPAARKARRLIVVEGQMDAIALDQAGIEEVVAPMGTALTDRQIDRAWRVTECPVLVFDGDEAGRKAALRACERAMPTVGPGRSLAIAMLPEGADPDSLVRSEGREAIEGLVQRSRSLSSWLFETLRVSADVVTPEGKSALWKRLAALAGTIRDEETRSQYLADWRARYEAAFPPAPPGLIDEDMLPDGEVADLSVLGEGDVGRLQSVAAAWLERSVAAQREAWALTPKRVGRWAWELGRRVGAGLIDSADGDDALEDIRAALVVQWPEANSGDLLRSFKFGAAKAASVLAAMRLDMRCALMHRSDKGNSERWVARYGEDYLYTTAKGWLGWDRRRYRVLNQEKDTTPAEVLSSVCRMIEAIYREAEFVRDSGWPEDEVLERDLLREVEADPDVDPRRPGGLDRLVMAGKKPQRLSEKLAAWAMASEASGRINCIPGLVKRDVTVELSEFDTDPMLLNCLNGTLRFIRGDDDGPARVELHPHRRGDRLTRLTACAYDENAAASKFIALVKWAQPEKARRRYLRQWLGYNLTGDMGEQIFHIWYGPLAANGKSTIGNACREAIGDYGDAGKAETFLDVGINKRGDAATPDIVRLPGIRMVTAGEPKSGLSIDEPLINGITGGDPMLARDNFRSFFRFLPVFKFTLWCNELPPIPRGTAGIWRRVKVMPWEQHLEEHERDRDLPEKLRAEYAGILAWMVRGAIDWMEHGFIEPEAVSLASADYKQDSDPIAAFLRACTVPDAAARSQSSVLYELFCAWAKAAGETEWKQKGFSQALKAKGLSKKSSNGMHWLGIKMVREPADFVDHEGRVKHIPDGLDDAGEHPARGPPSGAPSPLPGDDFIPGFDEG